MNQEKTTVSSQEIPDGFTGWPTFVEFCQDSVEINYVDEISIEWNCVTLPLRLCAVMLLSNLNILEATLEKSRRSGFLPALQLSHFFLHLPGSNFSKNLSCMLANVAFGVCPSPRPPYCCVSLTSSFTMRVMLYLTYLYILTS